MAAVRVVRALALSKQSAKEPIGGCPARLAPTHPEGDRGVLSAFISPATNACRTMVANTDSRHSLFWASSLSDRLSDEREAA